LKLLAFKGLSVFKEISLTITITMSETTKSAFIVKDLPKSTEGPEDLDELRKIKNDIARKLRQAKDKQFFDSHPNIAKLAQPVAQPGAIPRDKEEVKVAPEQSAPKVTETPMLSRGMAPGCAKPVDVPKPNQSKGTATYAPSPLIHNLVANISGGAKWF
jgi:hypothetical protein